MSDTTTTGAPKGGPIAPVDPEMPKDTPGTRPTGPESVLTPQQVAERKTYADPQVSVDPNKPTNPDDPNDKLRAEGPEVGDPAEIAAHVMHKEAKAVAKNAETEADEDTTARDEARERLEAAGVNVPDDFDDDEADESDEAKATRAAKAEAKRSKSAS